MSTPTITKLNINRVRNQVDITVSLPPGTTRWNLYRNGRFQFERTPTILTTTDGRFLWPGISYYWQASAVDANGVESELTVPTETVVFGEKPPYTGTPKLAVVLLSWADSVVKTCDSVMAAEQPLRDLCAWFAKQSGGHYSPQYGDIIAANLQTPYILPNVKDYYFDFYVTSKNPNAGRIGSDASLVIPAAKMVGVDATIVAIDLNGDFNAGHAGDLWIHGVNSICYGRCVPGTLFNTMVSSHEIGHVAGASHYGGIYAGENTVPEDLVGTKFVTYRGAENTPVGFIRYNNQELMGVIDPPPPMSAMPDYDPLSLNRMGWLQIPEVSGSGTYPLGKCLMVKVDNFGTGYVFYPAANGMKCQIRMASNWNTIDNHALRVEQPRLIFGSGATGFYDKYRKIFVEYLGGQLKVTYNSAGYVPPTEPPPPVVTPIKYPLEVVNGSGDGQYPAGFAVTITANPPPKRKKFSTWTGATVANATASTTTLVMPAEATTVTANYVRR